MNKLFIPSTYLFSFMCIIVVIIGKLLCLYLFIFCYRASIDSSVFTLKEFIPL